MNRVTTLVILCLCLALTSCDLPGDLGDMMTSASGVEDELLDQYGLNTSVSANMTNGRLTVVQVLVQFDEVTGMSIDDLSGQISDAVTKHFEEKPQSLLLTVAVSSQDG